MRCCDYRSESLCTHKAELFYLLEDRRAVRNRCLDHAIPEGYVFWRKFNTQAARDLELLKRKL